MRNFESYSPQELQYLPARCYHGVLDFTRIGFAFENRSKFIVGEHHKLIASALDDVIAGKCNRLIVNIAPRYGKTELISKKFIEYGFAINPRCKFILILFR